MNVALPNIAQIDRLRAQKIQELASTLGCRIIPLQQEAPLAQLSSEQSSRLRAIEQEIGISLVAYEGVPPLRLASPNEQQLKHLHTMEKQLGYVLVAYECPPAKSAPPVYRPSPDAEPAELSSAQYAQLQAMEEEVGLTLMAYKS